jgi:uncharacterized protein with NRDE domain
VCTILLAWRCLDDAGYVLAANRDELVARPADPPGPLGDPPRAFGGRDLLAGGTWLAVTPEGRLAAVTNRRRDDGDEVRRDPSRRSRGELPLRALAAAGAPEALAAIRPADYNPFNLLVIDGDLALVGHGDDAETLDVVELAPGPHVLCVHDVDDPAHAKERHLRERLETVLSRSRSAASCVEAMTETLRDHAHGADPRDAVCIHGDVYGTESASLITRTLDRAVIFSHAPGRPCTTGFSAVRLG